MSDQHISEPVLRDLLSMAYTHARGMWRFRWLAIATAWVICAVGWVVVYSMNNVYEANSRIYVDTDNVLGPLLQGIAISNDVMTEVNIVTREMLSRPNLAEVARSTDLDLAATTPQEFENLLTSLQNRIRVQGGRDKVFTISFEHPDRNKAQVVVQSLVDTFVEKSLGADRTDSLQAQSFLQKQINEYEDRLTEAEDRLATFKRENVAYMPDQRGDYFAKLQAAENSLQSTRSQLRITEERRDELQRQIDGEEPVFGIMTSPVGGDSPGDTGGFASSKIRELESELEVLRLQYTDKHPRIGQILESIDSLRAQVERERADKGIDTQGPSSLNPLDLNPVYQNMRIQLSNIDVEIASLRAEERQHAAEVYSLKELVDTMPQVEAELNRLNRDYGVVKAKYEQLVLQLETANIGDNVAQSIDDVQFRIIDPPYADITPIGPNRPLLTTLVLFMALGVGAGLAFLLNQINPVFIGKRSVSAITGLPVLASISLLQTDKQIAAERANVRMLMFGALLLVTSFVLITMFADQGSLFLRDLWAGVR